MTITAMRLVSSILCLPPFPLNLLQQLCNNCSLLLAGESFTTPPQSSSSAERFHIRCPHPLESVGAGEGKGLGAWREWEGHLTGAEIDGAFVFLSGE